MSGEPDVSVVMGVHNGARHLRATMESILTQEGVSLEFIVVNDGSTDESASILNEYARRDARVKLINQENQGLTRALINGCAAASGKYIARQDVGDLSLPGRLFKQVACIRQHADAALVSCGTQYVGPRGEHLYEAVQASEEAQAQLLTLDPAALRGPSSHGSALFPRLLYQQVGGYRSSFYFAQDIDLWIRLAEQGRYVPMPEVLFQVAVTVGAISSRHRKEQVRLTRLILESARLRRRGMCDAEVLKSAEAIKPIARRASSRKQRAKALYFIGSCLQKNNDPEARNYFIQALLAHPLHLKSAMRLFL